MRKIIVSFIAGLVMATSISVYADEGLQKIEAYVRSGLPILLDGQKVDLENPPVMVDGSTYLRLRDVAKITGVEVYWNESTQTVELTSVDAPPVQNKPVARSEVTVPTQTNEEQIQLLQNQINEINRSITSHKRGISLAESGLSPDNENLKNENLKKEINDHKNAIATYEVQKAALEAEKAQLESQIGTP